MSKRCLVAIVLLVFLSVTAQVILLASLAEPGLPLDDGWIHATYARNLARHGQLCLNPGEPSTGTTSFAWTALLASLRLAGTGPVAAPVALGIVCQAWLVAACFLLMRGAGLGWGWAFAAGASCALLGPLVWMSLAGMEATLFLALGLSAVCCWSHERWLAAGLLAGLLALTRPEGLALAAAMGLAEVGGPRVGGRGSRVPKSSSPVPGPSPPDPRPSALLRWLKLFAPVLVAAGIYLAVNLAITGQPLTSTFAGRRWLAGQPETIDFAPIAVAGRLASFLAAWGRYLHRWVFGTVLLAWVGVGEEGGAQTAGIALCCLLLAVACVGLVAVVRRRPGPDRGDPSALRLLAGWTLLHNTAYVLLLPVHGHAGRYQAVNFVLVALLVVAGAASLARMRSAARWLGPALLALWLALAAGGTMLWRAIYRDSVAHINTTHVGCGRWIAEHLPRDAVVATYDLGGIAYHAERRVVDLGGLVDPAMARHLFAGDCAPYLRQQGATHLAMVQHTLDDTGLLGALGLAPPAPGRPELHRLRYWSVPPERYHLHHIATSNAAPFMVLYRLRWPPG